MTRRLTFGDPLLPQPIPSWLVVRDRTSVALRPVLAAARDARIAAGWACDEVGPAGSGFFCSREGVRVYVGIERADPERLPF